MGFTEKLKRFAKPLFHLALIALLGLIAYSNTFNAPFQWDEEDFIVKNPVVKDLGNFKDPFLSKDLGPVGRRYIGYLSFALNYKFNGFDVRGWHVVNIAIHILNAMFVYFLVALTFKTPFLSNRLPRSNETGARNDGVEMSLRGRFDRSNLVALFAALLFVSHPIQTEAVTYIFQRLASLMAFFYLLSLMLYIKWRLSFSGHSALDAESSSLPLDSRLRGNDNIKRLFFYLLSLLSAVLAMKTKENAFTLPVMIALYEFFFFDGPIKKRILYLVPFLLTMLIIPLTVIGTNKPIGEMIGDAASLGSGYSDMSRWDYLFTQFRVIVTYIRLLFLPINQNLDYDYPVFNSFFNPQVFLSFLFLLSLLSLAVCLFYRSKNKPELRLISFGIFWFFIALSVESSVIPIPMVIDEYRVYLPSAGIFVALTAAISLLARERGLMKPAMAFLALLVVTFGGATYARNFIWQNEFRLIEDTLNKSPRKARVYLGLGNALLIRGRLPEAIDAYNRALEINPNYAEAYLNRGNAYLFLGQKEAAVLDYQMHDILKGRRKLGSPADSAF